MPQRARRPRYYLKAGKPKRPIDIKKAPPLFSKNYITDIRLKHFNEVTIQIMDKVDLKDQAHRRLLNAVTSLMAADLSGSCLEIEAASVELEIAKRQSQKLLHPSPDRKDT
jgi:hypothetical protein